MGMQINFCYFICQIPEKMSTFAETIEDLPGEILFDILEHLSGRDLLAATETTKILGAIALRQTRFLKRNLLELRHSESGDGAYFFPNRLKISGLKYTVQFLRNYGDKVLKLSIEDLNISKCQSQKTMSALNQRCPNVQVM